MSLFFRKPLLSVIHNHLIYYPSPLNLTYYWSFGALAGICLAIQLLTGIFLAMHYTPHVSLAFSSVEHIMRDVNFGWFLRYMHSNGASMFFIIVYLHMSKGLYYNSYLYSRKYLWISGVILFLLMMATAFMGYVLPWGQMSFWGATVITNLFSAIPYVGGDVAQWLWGGFSVDNATLNRFFSLHYLLPFLITGLVITHLILLHLPGSTQPLGFASKENISFYPYFYTKDLYSFFLFFLFFSFFVFKYPNVLGHPDNYIKANPMVTPEHIVPEWYFLPFYAILRSIPSKLGGVVCMISAIILLIFLPFINTAKISSPYFKEHFTYFFFFFCFLVIFLGWLGACPVEQPYILLSQIATFSYFFLLSIVLRFLTLVENYYIYGFFGSFNKFSVFLEKNHV